MELQEKRLVQELQKGSSQAMGKLYLAYGERAYGFALQMLKNEHDALDICHDAFIVVKEKISDFNPNNSFRAWLFSIVHSLSVERIRDGSLCKSLDQLIETSDDDLEYRLTSDAPNPDEALDRQILREDLEHLVSSLPPKQQAVVLLKYFQHMSYEDMAEALNCTLDAIKSRLHYARQQLGERWRWESPFR